MFIHVYSSCFCVSAREAVLTTCTEWTNIEMHENSIIWCNIEKKGANIHPGYMNGNNGRGFLADLKQTILYRIYK